MSVNLAVLDGVVKSLSVKYDAQSKPELRFTLAQETGGVNEHGQPWVSYFPCCASGATAERLAGELEDGQHVVVTSGKLCYRKRATKTGEKSRMEILVWQVDRLSASPGAETSPGDAPDSMPDGSTLHTEAARVPKTNKGKPRYQKWRPETTRPRGGPQ
jgi:single-stranded DNA-binding protein